MAKYAQRVNKDYGFNNPLQDTFPLPIKAQRSPANTDHSGMIVGTLWINVNPLSADYNKVWMFTSINANVAHWTLLG